ncbi:hypothetical protein A2U01_0094389, partial [Trifolium medium]|nr:hypothetical protein [Trifolium medium]
IFGGPDYQEDDSSVQE